MEKEVVLLAAMHQAGSVMTRFIYSELEIYSNSVHKIVVLAFTIMPRENF